MSLKNDFEEWKKAKWLAIYGAMIANQVSKHTEQGKSLSDADMARFKEEATAVADWEQEENPE